MVKVGIKGHQETTVTQANVAVNVGSGAVKVFSTPSMVALLEKTALLSVEPYLDEGQSTVGTAINITHSSATPEGMQVCADSEVIEVERRRIVFKVKAYDKAGLIGEGTHERFIIDIDKFTARAEAKKQQ